MAEILNEFDFNVARHSNGRLSGKYDWDAWLDGKIWRLKYDEDFSNPPESFRAMLHTMAKKYGKKVKTSRVGNDIIVQAYNL